MLACYMDDSADASQKTVFSVGGFVGDSSDWFDVERFWERRLRLEGLDYFRTWECINLEGEFKTKLVDRHGLTTARVIADAALADSKLLLATSKIYAFCLGVLMDDYRKVAAEPDGQIVLNKDPYIFAHHLLIGVVLEELTMFPGCEIMAFVYDEHSKASLLQGSWAGFKESNPTLGRHAGTLAPLDDKLHIPVQAADLLAHTTTRTYANNRRKICLNFSGSTGITAYTNAEIRLQVYQLKLDGLNLVYPEEKVVQSVQELLNNPLLCRDIRAKRDAQLDTVLRSIDKAVADQELDKLLQSWMRDHPESPTN